MSSVRLSALAEGTPGILQTADRLAAHIRRYRPALRLLVRALLYELPRDAGPLARAATLYGWVQAHVAYLPDHVHVEELSDPGDLLRQIDAYGHALGDCDDFVSLLGALFLSAGLPARLVLSSGRADRQFDHVYLRVLTERGWVAADPIHGEPLGWEVPIESVTARKEFDL